MFFYGDFLINVKILKMASQCNTRASGNMRALMHASEEASFLALSSALGDLPPLAGFFGKLYLFWWDGRQAHIS